jgi:hypothetical protein
MAAESARQYATAWMHDAEGRWSHENAYQQGTQMITFDIETGPLDEETVLEFSPPFQPPPRQGEFDPASVKVGNLKDQTKIDAKIAEARAAHEKSVADYEANVNAAYLQHVAQAMEAATLSPTTSSVIVIGYRAFDGRIAIDDGGGDERQLIRKFWQKYEKWRVDRRRIVGCNILGFDLPFLIRRSWILGIDVPATVKPGRYFDDLFVDVREAWLCGQRWSDCDSSLDVIARALGVGAKNGDGAMFWKLWAEDRDKAVAYLKNDLELAGNAAVRMGIV